MSISDIIDSFETEALKTKLKIKFRGKVFAEIDYKDLSAIAKALAGALEATEKKTLKTFCEDKEYKKEEFRSAEYQLYQTYCKRFRAKHHKMRYIKLPNFHDLNKKDRDSLAVVVKTLQGTGMSYEECVQVQEERLSMVGAFPKIIQLATPDAIRAIATKLHEAEYSPDQQAKTVEARDFSKETLRDNPQYAQLCTKIRNGRATQQDVRTAQSIYKRYTGEYSKRLNEILADKSYVE